MHCQMDMMAGMGFSCCSSRMIQRNCGLWFQKHIPSEFAAIRVFFPGATINLDHVSGGGYAQRSELELSNRCVCVCVYRTNIISQWTRTRGRLRYRSNYAENQHPHSNWEYKFANEWTPNALSVWMWLCVKCCECTANTPYDTIIYSIHEEEIFDLNWQRNTHTHTLLSTTICWISVYSNSIELCKSKAILCMLQCCSARASPLQSNLSTMNSDENRSDRNVNAEAASKGVLKY